MSSFERLIYTHLQEIYIHQRRQVKTIQLAARIPKNERIIRGVLADLERRGLVGRVRQRCGWYPTPPLAPPHKMERGIVNVR